MILSLDPKDATRRLLDLIKPFRKVVRYKVKHTKIHSFSMHQQHDLAEKEVMKIIASTKASSKTIPRHKLSQSY
jgi:hypothetical protein